MKPRILLPALTLFACLAVLPRLAEAEERTIELREFVARSRSLAELGLTGGAVPDGRQVLSAPEGLAGASCEVLPTSLDFGTVAVGLSLDLDFVIRNTGDAELRGLIRESCDHYSLVSGTGRYSIPPGESMVVTVRFEPTESGVFTCYIATGDGGCDDVYCIGDTGGRPNARGIWALHYAGPHDPGANTCDFGLTDCEDVAVDAPSGPGHYDIYVIAVDVDEIAGQRFGLTCEGPQPFFYGWTNCGVLEIPTSGWPGCDEGNATTWEAGQPGPNVTVGILDVYIYGPSSLSSGPDPRTGFGEWCDGSPEPLCHSTTSVEAFSTVGFGVAGSITCLGDSCFAPLLTSPEHESICVPTSATLLWDEVFGALGYEVQIGTSCGAGTVYPATSTGLVVSDLAPESEYYWRVRAECASGWGPWSVCRSFTTSLLPPGVPTLLSPSDSAGCVPTDVTLDWGDVSGAAVYEVEVGTSCGAGTVYSAVESNSTLTGLAAATTYYWKVRAGADCDVWGDWSECWSFTTLPSTPPAPALVSPPNTDCAPTDVALDWVDVPGAVAYEVQVGTSCGSGVTYVTTESDTTVLGLAMDTVYHWRVRAKADCNIWGSWSDCWSFVTYPPAPGVPVLTWPPDNVADWPTTVSLEWDCVAGAIGYEVQIGTSCGSGSVYASSSCGRTVTDLDYSTEYCWRVRAKGECEVRGDWSECWCFTTRPPGPHDNSRGKWALHYAGPHDPVVHNCSFQVLDCEDVQVHGPETPGRYDVYVIAIDVDAIAGTRYGLTCDGPVFFYGWTRCSDLEIPTAGWPGCDEGNAQVWPVEHGGPHVTVGILDIYVYGDSWLGTSPDPRTGFAEWCDGSTPEPVCYRTTDIEAFSRVGFGMPGEIRCEPPVPVGLAGFEAKPTELGILLEWSYADASDFRGFYVRRSLASPDGDYRRLHEDPIGGGPGGSGEYSYLDTDVIPGTLYYYKLEAIGAGKNNIFFGPYPAMAAERKAQYWLAQNSPNPFSRGSETTIHYSVAEAGVAEIRILDVAGRLVRTKTEHAKPGDNWITWNGTDESGRQVASGVYFYELRSGGFSAERKMLVVE